MLGGDAGDDLLIGDDLVIDSELATSLTAVQASMQQTFDALAAMMLAFDGLALDQSVVSQVVDHVTIPNRNLRYGNDAINGGSGEDVIVGDQGHNELPSTSTLPGPGNLKDQSVYLLNYLADIQTIVDDATQIASVAHLSVIDKLLDDARATRPSLPVVSPSSVTYLHDYKVIRGRDTINGGDDKDTILADNGMFLSPLVTGTAADLPETIITDGLGAEAYTELQQRLDVIATEHAQALHQHRAARSIQTDRELELRPSLDRIAYVPTLDFELGNDSISSGNGDDLVIGDDGVLATPLVLVTPQNELEARDLDVHVELLLDQLVNRDRARATSSYTQSAARTALDNSVTDNLLPADRHGFISAHWVIGQDTIEGEAGSDVLLGDRGSFVSPRYMDDDNRYVSLRRSAYGIGFQDDAERMLMSDPALTLVSKFLHGDVINGGTEADTLLGSLGNDEIDGQAGNDVVLGGNGRDILRGGSGVNEIRDDGSDYPRLNLSEQMGGYRHATATAIEAQLWRDAAIGGAHLAGWQIDTSTGSGSTNNGDPDTPPVPVTRTVTINGPVNSVTGQPITYQATVTDLPTGATARFAWEVTDALGRVVAVANGPSFDWAAGEVGTHTVSVRTHDDANGAGQSNSALQVQSRRLVADPSQAGMFKLIIGGTELNDNIRLLDVNRKPRSVEVRQSSGNGSQTRTVYDNISGIEVYGGEGNDDLSAATKLAMPLRLFGGSGDDKLRGGATGDFIDGGTGNDRLFGERGRDVLIGGWGADRISGGDAEDLLVADHLNQFSGTTDVDVLLQRWSLSGSSFDNRITDLIGDLTAARISDGSYDDLNGEKGSDWLLGETPDLMRLVNKDRDRVTRL